MNCGHTTQHTTKLKLCLLHISQFFNLVLNLLFTEETIDHKWNEDGLHAPVAENATNRIAICNLYWDRVKAADVFTIFSSFKPASSIIHSVTVSCY